LFYRDGEKEEWYSLKYLLTNILEKSFLLSIIFRIFVTNNPHINQNGEQIV